MFRSLHLYTDVIIICNSYNAVTSNKCTQFGNICATNIQYILIPFAMRFFNSYKLEAQPSINLSSLLA